MPKGSVNASPEKLELNPISMPLPESCTGGSRSASEIKIIVLHDSEIEPGPTALNTLHDVLAGQHLSIHIGINNNGQSARMVSDLVVAEHVAAYNQQALGIEQIGFSTYQNWPKAQTEMAAKWIAYWADKYGIPIAHSTTHGICTHKDLGEAGGGHVDPGPGYPFTEVLKEASHFSGKIFINEGEGSATTTTAEEGVSGGVSLAAVEAASKAAAFSTYLEIPGIFDSFESRALKGERSLLNDQPLMPFIEQLCQASLRRFQSMPNGNFYAFYPDYFGGMNHRTPYWEVRDIEIIDGKINLSDEPLATHVYVVGDTVGFYNGINEEDEAASAGVTTLFQAMAMNFITGLGPSKKAPNKEEALAKKDQVINFLKRYGARPYFEEAPMVRSGYYEMFLSFQRFCLLWSKQFEAEFQLTYMPEIFPGGLIALPDHGIQLFVEEVTHSFDYENGFTTTVMFSSPAALKGGQAGVEDGMIRAHALT